MGEHTVLVTGATGGIGEAVAYQLASDGYHLQLHYNLNREKALEIQRTIIDKFDVDVQILQADLSTSAGPYHLLEQLTPKPSILVHSAGLAHHALFQDVSSEDYERMIQLHVTSPFILTQKLLPSLLSRKWGRIIFITSIWAATGAANESLYAMAKGGMTSLMKSLALELGPSGITVNAVAPGAIDTSMNHVLSEEERIEISSQIPIGRFGTADEVAHSVAFLLHAKSAYITGQTLQINGGWHM
ncbi:elongation factor P 5-aminopentanone reductase [Bacillus horti]|uniref:3-oxoacyl-[acyl-carrier protein] reductase n=1 Tax=Caldalkalibacillus horti TaxID=77523 RepID=A0ABT9VUZ7_9BACI|nr:SDR family oxidoreductase [Bacillus horti]MDQ0164789.1 3-oxoacyl-[acyl-carrier protein] reductase [Bacillus horti]